MLAAARTVQELTAGSSYEDFQTDPRIHLSVAHAIQIIGEAASHISTAFAEAHPEVPWRDIVGQRHVIVHGYRDLDFAQIWAVVTVDLPELVKALAPLLPPLPPPLDAPSGE
jgi:uncharacterized protein with HEPN domain